MPHSYSRLNTLLSPLTCLNHTVCDEVTWSVSVARRCFLSASLLTMLADPGVVHADVVVTQFVAGDKAGGRQLHLCRYTDELCRVNTRLSTFLRAVAVADFAQRLGAERHRVGQMNERTTHLSVTSAPHTCHANSCKLSQSPEFLRAIRSFFLSTHFPPFHSFFTPCYYCPYK